MCIFSYISAKTRVGRSEVSFFNFFKGLAKLLYQLILIILHPKNSNNVALKKKKQREQDYAISKQHWVCKCEEIGWDMFLRKKNPRELLCSVALINENLNLFNF